MNLCTRPQRPPRLRCDQQNPPSRPFLAPNSPATGSHESAAASIGDEPLPCSDAALSAWLESAAMRRQRGRATERQTRATHAADGQDLAVKMAVELALCPSALHQPAEHAAAVTITAKVLSAMEAWATRPPLCVDAAAAAEGLAVGRGCARARARANAAAARPSRPRRSGAGGGRRRRGGGGWGVFRERDWGVVVQEEEAWLGAAGAPWLGGSLAVYVAGGAGC